MNRQLRFIRLVFILYGFLLPLAAGAQNLALVWSDEFNYSGLPDATRWTFEEGGHGWGNNELQYYTRDRSQNARVENGVLIIEAVRENFGGREYTSARLVSRGKGDWLYGRFEARAKLPGGRGTWAAIWMLPTDWAYGNWPSSGEIDIMEHVGYDPTRIFGTAHTEIYNHKLGTQKGGSVTGSSWESDFHVYAVEWTPEQISFIVDDNRFYTFPNEGGWEKWPFDKRFHFILNLAVGGSWGGAQGVDPSVFPKRMEIDYIRVYQAANLKITGPVYMEPGESAVFKATSYAGAGYSWQVPADASIKAGDGTPEITVTWGREEGEVKVDANINGSIATAANYVKLAVRPAGDLFWFGNLTDGQTGEYTVNTTDGSTFEFSESGESLRVIYHTVSPANWPRFEILLPRPVNLKEHPHCAINLKTFNLSRSVSLRFDFADINGTETNSTPVFRPVITADGRFHVYQNNFTGRWISSSPYVGQKVDSTRIIRMTAYVNAGVFGIPNKTDSLWIESIRFMKSPLTSTGPSETLNPEISVWPNPAAESATIRSSRPIHRITLYTLNGIPVRTLHFTGPECQVTIPLTGLPGGVYILEGDGGRSKIVKY